MDWIDSPEQAEFRQAVRDFVRERLPRRYREQAEGVTDLESEGGWQADRKSSDPERHRAAEEWASALASRGWIAPSWPQEYGGAGLSVREQFIFNQEMAEAGAPYVGGMGVSMIGPTLIHEGTPAQREEHLSRILSGDVAWAQGYSEPEAGSDLASLQMRAVREGDHYIVTGQKTWTSGAHFADWMFVLVRTDPEEPRHRGLTFLMVDLKSPGITIRPIEDMTWNRLFNDVFLDEVRVPVENRVGEENRGWYVGMTLLNFERSGIAAPIAYRRDIERMQEYLATADGQRKRRHDYESTRLELADRAIETEVLYNFAARIISIQDAGDVPGYEASVNKMFGADLHQRMARTLTQAWGLYANIWDDKDECAPLGAMHIRDYVAAVPHTIFAGSNEIQRNVIATRGLGLPRA